MKNLHTTKNKFFFVCSLFKVQFHGCLILKLDRLVEMKARCESKFSWTCFIYEQNKKKINKERKYLSIHSSLSSLSVARYIIRKFKPLSYCHDNEINFTFNFIYFPIFVPIGVPTMVFVACATIWHRNMPPANPVTWDLRPKHEIGVQSLPFLQK